MAIKFLRTLTCSTNGGATRVSHMMKMMYEFWGFCINGGASLTNPGGFATITPTTMPANFNGGTSLLASGSDGYTNATTIFRYDGYTNFYAQSTTPFLQSMVGKQLVMWKSGSGSSEDSIYNIINYISPSNIIININSGGTPSTPDGYKPSVTSRAAINYRVIDLQTAATATSDGNYFVMQLDPTGINTGQANSQVKFTIATTNTIMNAQLSPAGTWNGSAFTDGTIVFTSSNGNAQMPNASTGNVNFTLTGDKDFLIGTFQNQTNSNTYGAWMFHLEIPERLYTLAQDPNPITLLLMGYDQNLASTPFPRFQSSQSTNGYGGGFTMATHPTDTPTNNVRAYRTLVKATAGDGNADFGGSGGSGITNLCGLSLTDFRIALGPYSNVHVLASKAILCLPGITGQFSLARVKLRRVRFTSTVLPVFSRFDSGGDFMQFYNGIALPWDKTVLPFTLYPF